MTVNEEDFDISQEHSASVFIVKVTRTAGNWGYIGEEQREHSIQDTFLFPA
jgi:hypothetical protein